MSILGTFTDKQTVSRAGDDLTGVTLATLSHSLPATSPEVVLPVLRSAQAIGVSPAPQLLGVGGNASLATIGYHQMSAASTPTVMFDVLQIVFHSVIR